jgi:hypothetical protein
MAFSFRQRTWDLQGLSWDLDGNKTYSIHLPAEIAEKFAREWVSKTTIAQGCEDGAKAQG